MKTEVKKPSKTSKRLSTIAAITGSTAIIALAIAFVTVDFSGFMIAPAFTVDASIDALEPIRSDRRSDQDTDNENNSGSNGSDSDSDDIDGSGLNDGSENGDDTDRNGKDGFGDVDSDRYADHGLPCLDPNCPIHHGGGDGSNNDGSDNNSGDGSENDGSESGDSDSDRPPVDISAEQVSFIANEAIYVNQDEAEKTLSAYVDSINRYFNLYPEGKIYLVGCIAKTASWSLTETELSEERAEAVKQSLVKLGVDEDKLVAVGLGISDPWRQDEWSLGYFDEATAKRNRHVWLLPDQYKAQVDLIDKTRADIDAAKAAVKIEE